MSDTWSVERLRPVKGKKTYGMERVSQLSERAAEELAATWWTSNGTHALTVLKPHDVVSAIYEKEYRDRARIPPAWKWTTPAVKKVESPVGVPEAPKERSKAPPTLFNESEVKKAKVPAGGCIVCYQSFDPERSDKGSRDATPSGRIAAHRCPSCGMQLPHGTRAIDIEKSYLTAASVDPTPKKYRPPEDPF